MIIISQGHLNAISREDVDYLITTSAKHDLRLFTMPVVADPANFSISFESLAFATGGRSFLIHQNHAAQLDVYMETIDALREIRSRSEANGPALIYEKIVTNQEELVDGQFTIDQHVGNNTKFMVFTIDNGDNGLIKSLKIRDTRNKKYTKLSDEKLNLFSVYPVPPFDSVATSQNIF